MDEMRKLNKRSPTPPRARPRPRPVKRPVVTSEPSSTSLPDVVKPRGRARSPPSVAKFSSSRRALAALDEVKTRSEDETPKPSKRTKEKTTSDPFASLNLAPPGRISPANPRKSNFQEFPPLSPVGKHAGTRRKDPFANLSPIHNAGERGRENTKGPSLPSPLQIHFRQGSSKRLNPPSDDENEYMSCTDDHAPKIRFNAVPFPMATQDLRSMGSLRSIVENESQEASNNAGVSDDDEFHEADLSIRRIFLDPTVDPSTLCPYCDGPLPTNPTSQLISLLDAAARRSHPDPRPTNPLGRKAPVSSYIAACQRHKFESLWLPTAQRKGWPTQIDFKDAARRIRLFKDAFQRLLDDSENEENSCRSRCIFWREAVDEIRKKGSRAAAGVGGQLGNFEKTQPGYYGEQGFLVIHQTLYDLFPPNSIPPDSVSPLAPSEFIGKVLVPEAAVSLISEDLGLNYDEAVTTLRESARYGVAMFPDTTHNAGDDIVKQRAKTRKKELVAELGAAEADMEALDAPDSGNTDTGTTRKRQTLTESSDAGASDARGKRKVKREEKTDVVDPPDAASVPDVSTARRRKPEWRKKRGSDHDIDLSSSCERKSGSERASSRPMTEAKRRSPSLRITRSSTKASGQPVTADHSPSDSDSDRELLAKRIPPLVAARMRFKDPPPASLSGDAQETPRPSRRVAVLNDAHSAGDDHQEPLLSRTSASSVRSPVRTRRSTRNQKSAEDEWSRNLRDGYASSSSSTSTTEASRRKRKPHANSWLLSDESYSTGRSSPEV
ncbi:hypothetical protein PUNSTDRAFT_143007 [Punctularia strigosozonata HHB-11173 SS5]|uniref:uncharacterized protein n=1 Tax=Punctularia strigosozonata (strain HHB-11173) TaxID=741275 RepID=UPI0004417829|nr:uncharacterized protein PUNSTDRAFT_143007 [Punctularia strigosozonata HHB-11173 SS5]EIN09450.1 hypothetical protein PUNSTDRAFT_143007 [Punctularia strigosozonata HHB-11173 SS5]